MILNKKGVFNRCAVPEWGVKFKSKMQADEIEQKVQVAGTKLCLEDLIAAREDRRGRRR